MWTIRTRRIHPGLTRRCRALLERLGFPRTQDLVARVRPEPYLLRIPELVSMETKIPGDETYLRSFDLWIPLHWRYAKVDPVNPPSWQTKGGLWIPRERRVRWPELGVESRDRLDKIPGLGLLTGPLIRIATHPDLPQNTLVCYTGVPPLQVQAGWTRIYPKQWGQPLRKIEDLEPEPPGWWVPAARILESFAELAIQWRKHLPANALEDYHDRNPDPNRGPFVEMESYFVYNDRVYGPSILENVYTREYLNAWAQRPPTPREKK